MWSVFVRQLIALAVLVSSVLIVSSGVAVHAHNAEDCLARDPSKITTGPSGVQTTKYEVTVPDNSRTYDLRPSTWWANHGISPDQIRPLAFRWVKDGTCVVGGRVIGQQSRDLTWREMKTTYHGDGLFLGEGFGHMTVNGLRLDNAMDGVNPREKVWWSQDADWEVRGVYARFTRDDFVENDGLLNGVIADTLVDGTFVFLSNRPGSSYEKGMSPKPHVKISDSLIHVQRMPYDTDMGGDPPVPGSMVDGKAHGNPFKWHATDGGTVEVSDSIFMIDGLSINGATAGQMDFPPGTYSNVTLVWLGGGTKYPGTLPVSGVTVTTNRAVFDNARANWISTHCGGTSCL